MRAEEAAALFDAHAARYDRVNAIVSAGLERRWRRWVAERAVATPEARVLDAFAGTGAVGLACASKGAQVTLADASEGMLGVAARRAEDAGLRVRFARTDLAGAPLPFRASSFDAITAVFAVRYLDDPAAALARLAALLAPGGRMVVMEFVEPPQGLLHRAAGAYFFGVLPRIAAALAGSDRLYRYLAESTHALGSASGLDAVVRDAGLRVTEASTMGFGLVRGVVGEPKA